MQHFINERASARRKWQRSTCMCGGGVMRIQGVQLCSSVLSKWQRRPRSIDTGEWAHPHVHSWTLHLPSCFVILLLLLLYSFIIWVVCLTGNDDVDEAVASTTAFVITDAGGPLDYAKCRCINYSMDCGAQRQRFICVFCLFILLNQRTVVVVPHDWNDGDEAAEVAASASRALIQTHCWTGCFTCKRSVCICLLVALLLQTQISKNQYGYASGSMWQKRTKRSARQKKKNKKQKNKKKYVEKFVI